MRQRVSCLEALLMLQHVASNAMPQYLHLVSEHCSAAYVYFGKTLPARPQAAILMEGFPGHVM